MNMKKMNMEKDEKSVSYNIHDIIKLESFTELYELRYFNVGRHSDRPDMYIGDDISKQTYKELLCSIWIEPGTEQGENMYLGISNLINMSRHVLYVNLVEPLLRLMLIPKGYALLHLACLERGGRGIMISAPPDTGKTSCILKCLKANVDHDDMGISLLSDDMVIVSKNGDLLSFPKPFTISAHTLDSVFGTDTNLWYKIRSNVHSKGGRSAYKGMGTMNWLPIMSINALAQIVFEPPKLYPEDIVNVRIGECAKPDKLVFLSKDFQGEKEIERDDAVNLIRSNTDNAYITPPYDKIFPKLKIDGMSYDELIAEEAQITRNLIDTINPIVVGRKDYSWYEYVLNCIN